MSLSFVMAGLTRPSTSFLLLLNGLAPRQFPQARDHLRVRIGQRSNRGEMVGVDNSAEPCRKPGRAPGIDNALALPKIFRAFVFAHHGVEASTQCPVPDRRARSPRSCMVETQRVVDRRFDQRAEIEQARNGV